jgi:hypothetical protein
MALVVSVLAPNLWSNPHDPEVDTRAFLPGSWQVISIGLFNETANKSKLLSPSYEYYKFTSNGKGSFRANGKDTPFRWTFEGETLTMKFSDKYSEQFTNVVTSAGDIFDGLSLFGTFDYFSDSNLWQVSMGLLRIKS